MKVEKICCIIISFMGMVGSIYYISKVYTPVWFVVMVLFTAALVLSLSWKVGPEK